MKLTIITASYNSAATIKDTIASVNEQDYSDIEHIIIDGDSQDETLQIVLIDPVNAEIQNSVSILSIVDDYNEPSITIDDLIIREAGGFVYMAKNKKNFRLNSQGPILAASNDFIWNSIKELAIPKNHPYLTI